MVGYNDRLARVTNAAKFNDSSKPVKMQMSKKIKIMKNDNLFRVQLVFDENDKLTVYANEDKSECERILSKIENNNKTGLKYILI